jgi:hypothetical protein
MTIGKKVTTVDWIITKSTDMTNTFKVIKDAAPFDISGFEFYLAVRKNKSSTSELIFEILNADILQTASIVDGVVDTFTIDVTNSLVNVEQRLDYYEIRSKKISGGDNDVWFNGPFSVEWTLQEAR